jgi:hypothetical protein
MRIPYLDPIDLRYRNRVRLPVPTTKAVMFCLMDVSGSMDEARKELAKRFFILLYLFLTRHYDKIDLVFIRHHTQAQEVDEENFFHARETGGTVVSSALVLMDEIITAALSARRLEHLRRAGERRRQLAPRQRPLPRTADRDPAPEVPLFRLCAGREEEQNLWEEYARPPGDAVALRDAQGRRGVRDLSSFSRPVQGAWSQHMNPLERPAVEAAAPTRPAYAERSRPPRFALEQPLPPGRVPRRHCPTRATGASIWSNATTR